MTDIRKSDSQLQLERMYFAADSAFKQGREPVRFVIGAALWRWYRLSAAWFPENAPPNLRIWGIPAVVDESAGTGFGLVVR